MKRNLLLIGFVVSLSVNLAVAFTVAYHWWTRSETRLEPRRFIPEDLEKRLTERQLQEIEEMRRSTLARAQELRVALHERREALMEELRGAEPDQEKIDEILGDINRMQLELEKEVIRNLLRMKEVLPPQQRERVLDMMRERLRAPKEWRRPKLPVPDRLEGR